ncbi:pyridoxal 5''-phosphate synthase, glutaminase subunit Pdx2 [Thioflavicoccus mobilis 8321]|uniref:Pyridoxal 5'-phosphate synthase subunit PdxT n=1 Tax=Thioflavicoccus mobilis 8321 TaxID=765912 RepID=L0GUM8_9GAMM|nr:pyridoxal 5'-phosphate synthase glutaminase subunit PdxT [Thioflavicoccus mobilis]AGA89711.1 pyridoxal 5''-phosphate synthase, glutaminase subunit Pdx2 [Thioflavicoccus mobilis 8321]
MAGIGVLALQGGVVEHLEHLQRLGVGATPVKKAADLDGLAGLIIPGGESTCLRRLLHLYELDEAIAERFRAGLKLWGTCAGAILLAKRVVDGDPGLALIDIEIARNAFGSQLASFNTVADVPAVAAAPIPLTFIRAPKITALGPGVRSLLRIDDYYAAAEDDAILVTAFHPELTPSLAFHRYFATKCGIATVEADEVDWRPGDWTRYAPLPR